MTITIPKQVQNVVVETVNEPHKFFPKIGDRFKLGSMMEECILALPSINRIVMIELKSGNRWCDAVPVRPGRITLEFKVTDEDAFRNAIGDADNPIQYLYNGQWYDVNLD